MAPEAGTQPPQITGLFAGTPAEIIAAYNALRTFEGDYDRAQGQLRTIASAWLISAIGAIAYLVLQQINHIHDTTTGLDVTSGSALRQAVMFFVTMGMCAIWRIDQKVYQNLLHSIFGLAYWIEFKCPRVPPARMALFHGSSDITDNLGRFYSNPIILIWYCAVLNLSGAIIDANYLFVKISELRTLDPYGLVQFNNLGKWIIAAAILCVHTIYLRTVFVASREWSHLQEYLPAQAVAAKNATPPYMPARQP